MYIIENVKRGENDKVCGCEITGGPICISVKYKKDNEPSKWLELDDVMGIPNFYLSDHDLFDYHISFNSDDEDDIKNFNENFINEFEGVTFSGDYTGLFDQFYGEKKGNPAVLLLRYMILVANCSDEELTKFIDMVVGKSVDSVDIPISEIEQEYIEGLK